VVTTIELNFDADLRAAGPQQPSCSGLHATQKTSVKFLNPEDEAYVKPVCVGGISTISMGFTDTSEVSSTPDNMSTAISGEVRLADASPTVTDGVQDTAATTGGCAGVCSR
jgi:hypothetical protein